MLRCKEGDLALVIHDEPGCQMNIGRTVVVSGPVEIHPQYGPSWLIQPTHQGGWAVTMLGAVNIERSPLCRVEHPDKWLLPLRPPRPERRLTRRRKRRLPETQDVGSDATTPIAAMLRFEPRSSEVEVPEEQL
jgi:hypothetical protein